MSFVEDMDREMLGLDAAVGGAREELERFETEVEFAGRLAQAHPDRQEEWQTLILQGVACVRAAAAKRDNIGEAVRAAEGLMAPLGAAAKEYTIHCVGHAHIDMDWMWSWPETVATTNDTFTTVDRLMEEFPALRFSQSQASVYQILEDYLPELYARVKQRIAEGKWEVVASQWVEGDKNLASGEILCRHLLYTKRFFSRKLGLPYDAVKIDWEPDTFGHAHTIPTILTKAGVRRYYFCRAGPGPRLFWWQGKDGSRVLAYDDRTLWYLGPLAPRMTSLLFEFEQATGLKDYLFVYGVGDHGGGPTRRDMRAALKMDTWPIFPNVKLSTTDAFFSIAEAQAKDLPVVDAEMNFVFEGCYTSQSNIKRANRKSENALVEAEAYALLGKGLAGLPYPSEPLYVGWRHAMFNQFHDILPGSGVHATYEHSQGLYQEILAQTTMVKTRALRTIAGLVDTGAACPCEPKMPAPAGDIGGGQGDVPAQGALSRRGAGGVCCDPFVVFNPSPWRRSELVSVRIWDRAHANGQIIVVDDARRAIPAQVIERGNFWQHEYIGVVFPARDIEGLGYRSYSIARAPSPGVGGGCSGDGKGTIENEFLKATVDPSSGAIAHLIDKRSGMDLVAPGERIGLLEYVLEAPHGMSAWAIGQIVERVPFTEGGTIECPQNGPYLASVVAHHTLKDSRFTMTMSLAAGLPRFDLTLEVDWLERGSPTIGVPALKVAFPLAIHDAVATFECPNGYVERPTDMRRLPTYTHMYIPPARNALYAEDVPAQKWADLTGTRDDTPQPVGATLLNDSKYGHSVSGSTLRLSLLRSSCDPDPLPELGRHTIRFALRPHVGAWTPSDSTRAGYEFNFPFEPVSTDMHEGSLPARKGFAELLTPNVMLSGLKKAEDSDALIVRLYEIEGKPTTARVRLDEALAPPNAPAVETDLLEQPLGQSSARMDADVLTVEVPRFGLVTVKVG